MLEPWVACSPCKTLLPKCNCFGSSIMTTVIRIWSLLVLKDIFTRRRNYVASWWSHDCLNRWHQPNKITRTKSKCNCITTVDRIYSVVKKLILIVVSHLADTMTASLSLHLSAGNDFKHCLDKRKSPGKNTDPAARTVSMVPGVLSARQ